MFEKEAEEYANERSQKLNIDQASLTYSCMKVAYQKGAEFGYNKANKWYKPSEKLPEECTLVLAYLFEETEPTLCKYVVSNQWECLPKRIVFYSNDQVIAWKEIVLPKEVTK